MDEFCRMPNCSRFAKRFESFKWLEKGPAGLITGNSLYFDPKTGPRIATVFIQRQILSTYQYLDAMTGDFPVYLEKQARHPGSRDDHLPEQGPGCP